MKSRRQGEHPARNYLASLWEQLEREKDKPTVALIKSIQEGLEHAGSMIDQLSPLESEERTLLGLLVQCAEIRTMEVGGGKKKEYLEIVNRDNYEFIIKRLIELRKKHP
jgi:hypothetical protein